MSAEPVQPPGNVLSPAPTPVPVDVTRFRCPEPGCDTLSKTDRGIRLHAARVHGERLTHVLMACVQCRDTFYVQPSRQDSARYCSRDCKADATETHAPEVVSTPPAAVEVVVTRYECPIDSCDHLAKTERGAQKHVTDVHPGDGRATLACLRCGVRFERKASAISYAQYCSRQCRDLARRRRVTCRCEACGDTFWTHRYRASDARFCSYACWQFSGLSIPNLVRIDPAALGLAPCGEVRPPTGYSYLPDGVVFDG